MLSACENLAAETHQRSDRAVDPQVDREHVGTLAHGLHAVRRSTDPPADRLRLPHQTDGHKIGDETTDRAPVESGVAHDLRAGRRPVVVQEPGQRRQVVATDLVLGGTCE